MSIARNLATLANKIRFNTVSGLPEWYGSLGWQSIAKYDYIAVGFPTATVNPVAPYSTWYSTTVKSLFICTDNTTNANIWREITSIGNAARFDFFGDSSAVALYPCDGGSGFDASGLYTMGTNGFTSGAGKFNTCATGNPAYMACGSVAGGTAPNNNKIITVSLWFNTAASGDNWLWSSGKYSNGTCRRGVMLSGNVITTNNYDVEYGAISSLTFTANSWVHLCVTGDKVYKDGVLAATMASYSAPTSDTYGFYVGANGAYDYGYVGNETYGKPMNGSIDQVRIFNRVLTADEVRALYVEAV